MDILATRGPQNPSTVFDASWLSNLSRDALDAFRASCSFVKVPNGHSIYRLGSRQNRLWGVAEGQVRVHVATNEMQPVLGHIHTPGSWFGEVEFVLSQPAYVEMAAAGDSMLCRVDGKNFRRLARQFPELWESVARLASLNLWMATSAANDLALRTGQKRIAAVILRLSGNRAAVQNNAPVDTIHASQQEVAELSNVARTTAWKILKEFRKLGLIELDYARVTILSRQGLLDVLAD
jgi:CRP-like cAMP-binding protein